jgi:hypothetical protein
MIVFEMRPHPTFSSKKCKQNELFLELVLIVVV